MPAPYQHQIDSCFDTAIGPNGLVRATFDRLVADARPAVEALAGRRLAGDMPLLALPRESGDISALQPVAARLRAEFEDVVVLGTGGSSLGAQALAALAPADAAPRLHMPDNLDGGGFAELLAGLPPPRTAFLAVSKSGGTAETLAQTLAAMAWLQAARGESAIAGQMIAIAEPGDNPLRRLCGRFRVPVLDHDPDLGGRYSVLSLVGLLPAMVLGIDVQALRGAAAAVLDQTLSEPGAPAVAGAAIAVGLARERSIATNVLMPYASRLERFAAWYRQLWAESLGKDGRGLTPIAALGPVDQHSQLQLWLGGPADKWFTLIEVEAQGRGPALDLGLAGNDPALGYLAGHTIGDLVAAETRATAETLAGRGRPVRLIRLAALDAAALGALCMHFMLETVIAAHLLGVDPFDQPAVEEGKVLARQYLAGDDAGADR